MQVLERELEKKKTPAKVTCCTWALNVEQSFGEQASKEWKCKVYQIAQCTCHDWQMKRDHKQVALNYGAERLVLI